MGTFARLLRESGLYGLTIPQVLDLVLKFEDKTLIFFDTETLGMHPEPEETQLTEVAAIAFDGTTFRELGRFQYKAKLNQRAREFVKEPSPSPTEKSGKDLLRMTRYGEKNAEFVGEKELLKRFSEFVSQYVSPIMIAHNATFDMRFINVRAKRHGIQFKRVLVIDTMRIAQLFFLPVLKTVHDNTILNQLLTKKGFHSVSLGILSPALNVNVKNWHSAFADVESLIGVTREILAYLKSHKDVDISKEHGRAVQKVTWMRNHQR